MSFAPPSGPPPPSVPEGWKAQYDDRYQTWYVFAHLNEVQNTDNQPGIMWTLPQANRSGIAPKLPHRVVTPVFQPILSRHRTAIQGLAT
jgi:hypothetical protein